MFTHGDCRFNSWNGGIGLSEITIAKFFRNFYIPYNEIKLKFLGGKIMKLSKRANFWLSIIGVIGVLVEYGLFNLFLYKLNKESIEAKKCQMRFSNLIRNVKDLKTQLGCLV